MQVVRRIEAAVCGSYFNLALFLGFTQHVYELSNDWGGRSGEVSLGQSDAAHYATVQLQRHHGYYECPSCRWATKTLNEHLSPGTWCFDEETRDQNVQHSKSLSAIMAGLDRELCMDLEKCPHGCNEILDCCELEMHGLLSCDVANAMYA